MSNGLSDEDRAELLYELKKAKAKRELVAGFCLGLF